MGSRGNFRTLPLLTKQSQHYSASSFPCCPHMDLNIETTGFILTLEVMEISSVLHDCVPKPRSARDWSERCFLLMTLQYLHIQWKPLHRHINCFANGCKKLSPTIRIKKSNVMDQWVSRTSSFSTIDHILEVEGEFTYLGSTIASNLSLDLLTCCQKKFSIDRAFFTEAREWFLLFN